MSHVKSAGARAHQKANVVGKRLGLKVSAGQYINAGSILVRQRGTKYHAGENVKIARNYDLIARVSGIVKFTRVKRPTGIKTVVNVEPVDAK